MLQFDEFGHIPQPILDITANRCKLLDEYILFQSGAHKYTALIRDMTTGKVTQLTFTCDKDYTLFDVTETEGSWEYTILNEYYTYSNLGLGSALDLPVYDGVQAHCSVVFTVCLMFLVVFRGILFPFKKKRK